MNKYRDFRHKLTFLLSVADIAQQGLGTRDRQACRSKTDIDQGPLLAACCPLLCWHLQTQNPNSLRCSSQSRGNGS